MHMRTCDRKSGGSRTPTPPPGLAASFRHAESQGEFPDPALIAMAAALGRGPSVAPALERASSVNSNSEGGTFLAISQGGLELTQRARTLTDYKAMNGTRKRKK